MIVAAGAVDGESLEALHRGARHVVHVIEPVVGIFQIAIEDPGSKADEASGGHGVERRDWSIRRRPAAR